MKVVNKGCLFFVLLLLGSCNLKGTKCDRNKIPAAKAINSESKPKLSVSSKDTSIVVKTPFVIIQDSITFVQVNGDKALKIYLGNIILDYFDQVIFNEKTASVFEYENRFYSLVERLKIQLNENLNEYKNKEVQRWYGNYRSEVLNITSNFVTLKLGYSQYYGGAHGMYGTTYKVFDRNKYELLDVKNTFKDVKGLKMVVEKNLLVYLKEHSISMNDLLVSSVEFEVTDNFYFKDDQVFFNYNVYEIAPYYLGEIEFGVPMQEIRPFLIKDIAL